MVTPPEHITWTTALRLAANLLTACVAMGWLRFADCREGVLSSPNLHHRVYLRILVTLSCAAFVATLLSLAATAHAASTRGEDDQRSQPYRSAASTQPGVDAVATEAHRAKTTASDTSDADR